MSPPVPPQDRAFSSLAATQFGQVLVHLDTTQQEIAGALKDNTVLLAEVGPPPTPAVPPSGVPILPPPPLLHSPPPHFFPPTLRRSRRR